MTVIEFPSQANTRPDFRRKGGTPNGAPLIVDLAGKTRTYRRPSGFARPLEDAYHLDKWRKRTTARGAALLDHPAASKEHRDAAQALRDIDPDDRNDREAFDLLADLAFEIGGGNARADLGTERHGHVEAWNLGKLALEDQPFEVARDVEAFAAALRRHGLTIDPAYVEHHVVCDELRAAGTLDFVTVLDDGRRFVGDLKTGDTIDLAQVAHAVQLAIYAHGVTYDVVRERRGQLLGVSQDEALIFHLPCNSGVCTCYAVDIAEGWKAALLANDARTWNYRRDLLAPFPEDLQLALSIASHPARLAADGKPAPPRIEPVAPTPAAWIVPNGRTITDPTRATKAILDGFRRFGVTGAREAVVAKWRDESKIGGRSFSFADRPCERTRDIYRAVARLAAYVVEVDGTVDDVLARILLTIATGTEHEPPETIGHALGSLTIDQAHVLGYACERFLEGAPLTFGDDGRPNLPGEAGT